jgi:hypothetical protein
MTSLTNVIYGFTVMTYGARQRRPKGRTSESCSRSAAAVRSTSRCSRAIGAGLFDFASSSLSLSTAGPRVEGASSGERIQVGVHGQASTPFDSARAVVRLCQKDLDQRSRESSARGVLITRGRSWLSQSRSRRATFSWSIALIACCPTSWLRYISYSCPSGGGRWAVRPPDPMQLSRR